MDKYIHFDLPNAVHGIPELGKGVDAAEHKGHEPQDCRNNTLGGFFIILQHLLYGRTALFPHYVIQLPENGCPGFLLVKWESGQGRGKQDQGNDGKQDIEGDRCGQPPRFFLKIMQEGIEQQLCQPVTCLSCSVDFLLMIRPH